jgi:hypothetical protein
LSGSLCEKIPVMIQDKCHYQITPKLILVADTGVSIHISASTISSCLIAF